MKFTEHIEYPMDLGRVETMSLDPEYVRSRIAGLLTDCEISVDGRTISAQGLVNADLIPAAGRAFLRGPVAASFTETWSGEGSTRTAVSNLAADGAPVKASLISRLSAAGSSTARDVEGELTVSIPFIGTKIEKEAVSRASDIIAAEVRLAKKWDADHRA